MLDVTWLIETWTHSSCGYLHKTGRKEKDLEIGGSLGGGKEEFGKSWRGIRKGNKVNMFIVYYKHVWEY